MTREQEVFEMKSKEKLAFRTRRLIVEYAYERVKTFPDEDVHDIMEEMHYRMGICDLEEQALQMAGKIKGEL